MNAYLYPAIFFNKTNSGSHKIRRGSFLGSKKKIVVEEVFCSANTDERKRLFNIIFVRVINKSK